MGVPDNIMDTENVAYASAGPPQRNMDTDAGLANVLDTENPAYGSLVPMHAASDVATHDIGDIMDTKNPAYGSQMKLLDEGIQGQRAKMKAPTADYESLISPYPTTGMQAKTGRVGESEDPYTALIAPSTGPGNDGKVSGIPTYEDVRRFRHAEADYTKVM